MFYITSEARPAGWVNLSDATSWERWLRRNIPTSLNAGMRARLTSNLKHILVGLELKKALILPHAQRGNGERGVLFEPYFQTLIFEFCVGCYSVVEGLGAAHWLDHSDLDGSAGNRIGRNEWRASLCAVYDEDSDRRLQNDVTEVGNVRDKIHQDKIGVRTEIDWHALGFNSAFAPANRAIETILLREDALVPDESNLPAQSAQQN